MQIKEGLKKVLPEYVGRQGLSVAQAIKIVRDIFFDTANQIYDLGLDHVSIPQSGHLHDREVDGREMQTRGELASSSSQPQKLKAFIDRHKDIKFLRLQWVDFTATLRVRVVPKEQAIKMFGHGKSIGVAPAVFGLLQNDRIVDGFTPIGEYLLHPDLTSLRPSGRQSYASAQCDFKEHGGAEVDICPRTILQRQVRRGLEHGINFQIGFEIEVTFMNRELVNGFFVYGREPVAEGHAW